MRGVNGVNGVFLETGRQPAGLNEEFDFVGNDLICDAFGDALTIDVNPLVGVADGVIGFVLSSPAALLQVGMYAIVIHMINRKKL